MKTADKLRADKKYAAAWDEYGRVASSTYLPGSGMLGQARVAMDQGQFDKAISSAQAAAKAGADRVSALRTKAQAQVKAGKSQDAVGTYKTLIALAKGKTLEAIKSEYDALKQSCKTCSFK